MPTFCINIKINAQKLSDSLEISSRKIGELIISHHSGISMLHSDFRLDTDGFCISCYKDKELVTDVD